MSTTHQGEGDPRGDTWSEKLAYYGYTAGWALTQRIPEPVASWMFTRVADLASKNGKGPEQLRRNLARVVGPENVTRDLVKASMRSYLRYWMEAFRLPAMAGPELARRVEVTDYLRKCVVQGQQDGRGVIFLLTHSANWDMSGVWLVDAVGGFTTVAERLKPAALFDAFVRFRESLGFEVIALTGAETPPMDVLEEILRRGGFVCLLAERDLTGKGIPVDFFGAKCSMPAGGALLAQRTGATMYVVNNSFTDGGWRMNLSPQLDTSQPVEQIVQQQADFFAQYITENPQDWHMLQPLWWDDLSATRLQKMGVQEQHARAKGEQ